MAALVRILVTCDRKDPVVDPASHGAEGARPLRNASPSRVRPPRAQVLLAESIVTHLRAAGALVLLAPPDEAPDVDALLEGIDGVVITGGAHDIHPRHYGQDVTARIDRVEEGRAGLELPLARACAARGLPLLGVCGGMQALAVALGGTLVQDIRTRDPGALEHEQPTDPAEPWHAVEVSGPLAGRVGTHVNSTHHQAVDALGPLAVCAVAPDSVVEGVYLPGHPFCVGVQWHPELLDGRLFMALVDAARERRA